MIGETFTLYVPKINNVFDVMLEWAERISVGSYWRHGWKDNSAYIFLK